MAFAPSPRVPEGPPDLLSVRLAWFIYDVSDEQKEAIMSEAAVSGLPIFERELEEAERRAKALRAVVEGLRALNGHAPLIPAQTPRQNSEHAVDTVRVPKGMQAVLAITAERPGRWTRREILSEFEERGWFHTVDRRKAEGAVDAAIHRLCSLGRATKVEGKPGTYSFGERQEVLT
jgi:hypothetical protein